MNSVTFKTYDYQQAQQALNLLAEEYGIGTSASHISGRAVTMTIQHGNSVTIKSRGFSQHTLETSAAKVIEKLGLYYCNQGLSFVE